MIRLCIWIGRISMNLRLKGKVAFLRCTRGFQSMFLIKSLRVEILYRFMSCHLVKIKVKTRIVYQNMTPPLTK
jgi:hypothetical protein